MDAMAMQTALASFYVSDTDWYLIWGDFECNRDIRPVDSVRDGIDAQCSEHEV